MTLTQLKDRYARLRDEIDAWGGDGRPNGDRLAQLKDELNQVDEALADYRRRAIAVPTLSDVIFLDAPERRGGLASAHASRDA